MKGNCLLSRKVIVYYNILNVLCWPIFPYFLCMQQTTSLSVNQHEYNNNFWLRLEYIN